MKKTETELKMEIIKEQIKLVLQRRGIQDVRVEPYHSQNYAGVYFAVHSFISYDQLDNYAPGNVTTKIIGKNEFSDVSEKKRWAFLKFLEKIL